jgi:predicted hotdog family 3-hydroxylacyl-ACP dehydratase
MMDRAAIGGLIPHAGSMCLLDEVLFWDSETIRCRSTQHRRVDNPLRQAGRLGGVSGIEFAAQAMAAHGRLTAPSGEPPKGGLIASLRDIACDCAKLEQIDDDLIITATRLMGDDEHVIYTFAVTAGAKELLTGRATVVLRAETPS